jgi:hypothetical protein
MIAAVTALPVAMAGHRSLLVGPLGVASATERGNSHTAGGRCVTLAEANLEPGHKSAATLASAAPSHSRRRLGALPIRVHRNLEHTHYPTRICPVVRRTCLGMVSRCRWLQTTSLRSLNSHVGYDRLRRRCHAKTRSYVERTSISGTSGITALYLGERTTRIGSPIVPRIGTDRAFYPAEAYQAGPCYAGIEDPIGGRGGWYAGAIPTTEGRRSRHADSECASSHYSKRRRPVSCCCDVEPAG